MQLRRARLCLDCEELHEEPHCPVYIDGEHVTTLRGTYEELAEGFRSLVDNYIAGRYAQK